jgi:hypothetical protein
MPEQEYIGKFVYATKDAILFIPDSAEDNIGVWLPKSQIDWDEDIEFAMLDKYDPITLIIPDWLAIEKEIE